MKKGGELFDVTMGAYDGAEVCELVGILLLHTLKQKYQDNNFGLYRDDGLAIFENVTGPQSERIKKDLRSTFKQFGLDIVIECNKSIVNYLDVTLNLKEGTYKPYQKPDNTLQYIHTKSNHPRNIIDQIPKTIENRLSKNSSNEKIFKDAAKSYEEALKNSGYNCTLNFNPNANKNEINNTQNRNRKRKIIWFNPPYSKNVTTKIGKYFLNLLDKHFPKNHKYHKLFNRNNVKISYSCTKNMKSIITDHNKSILNPSKQSQEGCNCRNKNNCPLDGKCLSENIIYKATLNSNKPNHKPQVYIGLTEPTFKTRYGNHKKAFNNKRYQTDTELSKAVWKLKSDNFDYNINWEIVRKCAPVNVTKVKCNLCLNEKLDIATYKDDNIINQRSELISKCRHINKHLLKNFKMKKK